MKLDKSTIINGDLVDLRKVSCLECIVRSSVSGWRGDAGQYHYLDIFPHFVTVGHRYFDPVASCITSVSFTTRDLAAIFNDFDAYGHLFAEKETIEMLATQGKHPRNIRFGDSPQLFYFSGKLEIANVDTQIGTFQILHQPKSEVGAFGISIADNIFVNIRFEKPIDFQLCIDRVMSAHRFFSLLAGRTQTFECMSLGLQGERMKSLELHWMHSPRGNVDESNKPNSWDIPLDAVRRYGEFSTVLKNWIEREPGWRPARIRHAGCADKANHYSVDRLVAAANMFDILPMDAVPAEPPLSGELLKAREECRKIFKRLEKSAEREGVLNALGRIGKPTLTKKVLHRVEIVNSQVSRFFPDLAVAAIVAIKARNFFVHGAQAGFDYAKVEPSMPFLSDALEFIFAASDLIEAGWDAVAWAERGFSGSHSFASFRMGYLEQIDGLKGALSK